MSKKASTKVQSKGGKKAKATKPRIKVTGDETPAQQTAPETAPAAEPAAAPVPKKGKKTKAHASKTHGTMSGLDAAAKVLADAKEPLDCKTIVERAFARGLWTSDGATPAATIYSAVLREIQKKGEQSRFRKTDKGKFAIAK